MSTSLLTLRTRTRRYLNEVTASRWTDAELTAFVNEGIRFTQSEIDRANPDYFLRVTTFTASAGSYQAALPSTIWGHRLRNVQFYENSTVPTGLPTRVQPGQLEWIYQNQHYAGVPKVYYPLAGYLLWAPLLQYDSVFRFIYAKKENDLVDDVDPVDAISDEYTDIIAIYAAILAMESRNIPTGTYQNLLARKIAQMANDCQSTDPLIIPQQGIDD